MAIQTWTGRVDAKTETPISTGLNFRPGARVIIVSSGTAQAGENLRWSGPSGIGLFVHGDSLAPEEWILALLVKTGSIYTSVGGGLLNWSPPTDDNVEFVVNDVPGLYGDNRGGFDVIMQYDDENLMR